MQIRFSTHGCPKGAVATIPMPTVASGLAGDAGCGPRAIWKHPVSGQSPGDMGREPGKELRS